ncbi:MAG TPA: MmgE/PrpD family protein [Burkholderiales bacterium]|nr:MmgE/PrpD family protein [Burkholderiales bacterium]
MSGPANLTRDLCRRMVATTFDDLGAECVSRVRQAIQDGIAVAVAGATERTVVVLAEHVKSLGGTRQASVWGHGHKTSTVQAAYVNGVATHVLDFEPMWLPPTHAVSPVLPVALALAEADGHAGREVVTAVARGMELQGRLQYAGNQFEPQKLRFHPPGVAGVFGAAAAAGALLGLDEQKLAWALGIAGSRAGALLPNIGTMTKATHCGHAARSGLDAALLAARGFTASEQIFEAPRGAIDTYFPDGFDAQKLLDFGRPYRMVDPGLAIKNFPSQFATHWAITAALGVRDAVGDLSKIERVVITSPVMQYIDRPKPANGHEGKFSFQYTAAAALLDGAVTIDTFTDKRRFSPDMEALLGRIELRQDPSIAGEWLNMRVDIEVTAGGRTLTHTCTGPKGAWGQAPLTAADHGVKLRDCLRRGLAAAAVDELLELVSRFDTLEAAEVKRICELIGKRSRRKQSADAH